MTMTWGVFGSDLRIQDGSLVTVYGAEEVRQRIIISLQHYWGEYFLNIEDGVPWYELILGSKDKRMVELILRQAVMAVPGVIGIDTFKTIYESGGLTIDLIAEVENFNGSSDTIELNITMGG